jgi:hypothetical protein
MSCLKTGEGARKALGNALHERFRLSTRVMNIDVSVIIEELESHGYYVAPIPQGDPK